MIGLFAITVLLAVLIAFLIDLFGDNSDNDEWKDLH